MSRAPTGRPAPAHPPTRNGDRLRTEPAHGLLDAAGAKPVQSPPPEVLSALTDARLLGQGELRFFGLLLYEARLWVGTRFAANDYAQHAFALQIDYARKLDGVAIAERSIAEMRRVGAFSPAQGQAWLSALCNAFPDVAATDRLVGLNDGRGGTQFFHNGRATAQMDDAVFSHLFFGIWLDSKTSATALRQALLGLTGAAAGTPR